MKKLFFAAVILVMGFSAFAKEKILEFNTNGFTDYPNIKSVTTFSFTGKDLEDTFELKVVFFSFFSSGSYITSILPFNNGYVVKCMEFNSTKICSEYFVKEGMTLSVYVEFGNTYAWTKDLLVKIVSMEPNKMKISVQYPDFITEEEIR